MLINPRLTDYHGIPGTQEKFDFAIPFFNEDIPLYLDPFLLWRSPSLQDQSLHTGLVNAFNHLGHLSKKGNGQQAIETLVIASECDEIGLGSSAKRLGKRIGETKASDILRLFDLVPDYQNRGFRHFEEIQLFVDGISKDRISDIACSFLKSFLIDFTIGQCDTLGIPTKDCEVKFVYDYRQNEFRAEKTKLPFNPEAGGPLILVPKRWLRFTPWIAYDDYFKSYCPQDDISHSGETLERVDVLTFNRNNYGIADAYVRERERTFEDCKNDPLFSLIPIVSAKRKFASILKLKTGKSETQIESMNGSWESFFPRCYIPSGFCELQSRTESGAMVRDVIFYNGREHEFLKELYQDYASSQIVFELKNVNEVSRDHLNQLNRYMTDSLGKFGILITRNPLTKARMQSTIDLWAGQRRCI